MIRFSINGLLATTAFIAIVIWTVSGPVPSVSIRRFWVALVVISSGTSYLNRFSFPTYRAVLIAVLFFVAFYSIEWIKMWMEYFRQTQIPPPPPPKGMIGWPPYFEDGMIREGFVFPAIGFVILTPFVFGIAFFVSVLTVVSSKMISHRHSQRFDASKDSDSLVRPQ
jgi:hypothetical protein